MEVLWVIDEFRKQDVKRTGYGDHFYNKRWYSRIEIWQLNPVQFLGQVPHDTRSMCCIMFPETPNAFMYVMPVSNFQKGTFSCPSFVNTAVLAAFYRNSRSSPMWTCPRWDSVFGQVDVEQRRAWRHWSYISIFVFCWLFFFVLFLES